MGLITKEVETIWYSRNIKPYMEKGYQFTKAGDKFLVNINDLSHGSQVPVEVECDNCHTHNIIHYHVFHKCKRDNKYYCRKCAKNLFGSKKMQNTKLINSTSFKDWCINNNRLDILNLWDYTLNSKLPEEVSYGSKDKYYFKCPSGKHESFNRCIHSITHGNFQVNSACDQCNSFGFWCENNNHRDYLNLWDYSLNNCSPYNVRYGSHSLYFFKCPQEKHESSKIQIKRLISGNTSICPNCTRERSESFLQEKVRIYISEKYDYKINHEYNCTIIPINPRTSKPLPFDNEIIDLNLIVEVNGHQHYKLSPWHQTIAKHSGRTEDEEFKYQKIKDRYKRIIAHLNNFHYLEIPYWTERDESYKQLIDEKINSILKG